MGACSGPCVGVTGGGGRCTAGGGGSASAAQQRAWGSGAHSQSELLRQCVEEEDHMKILVLLVM